MGTVGFSTVKAQKSMENRYVCSLKNPNKATTNEVRITNKYIEVVTKDEDLAVVVNLIMNTLKTT